MSKYSNIIAKNNMNFYNKEKNFKTLRAVECPYILMALVPFTAVKSSDNLPTA
jgi:hypothetical protein